MKLMAVQSNEAGPERRAEPLLTLKLAHLYRSRIIDKCAQAERHVLTILRAAGGCLSARASLSQKLGALRKLLGDGRPGIDFNRLRSLLERLEQLSIMRAELAHSTLTIVEEAGHRVAVLRNAAAEGTADCIPMRLTLPGLVRFHWDMSDVANRLGQAAEQMTEAGFPLSRE